MGVDVAEPRLPEEPPGGLPSSLVRGGHADDLVPFLEGIGMAEESREEALIPLSRNAIDTADQVVARSGIRPCDAHRGGGNSGHKHPATHAIPIHDAVPNS